MPISSTLDSLRKYRIPIITIMDKAQCQKNHIFVKFLLELGSSKLFSKVFVHSSYTAPHYKMIIVELTIRRMIYQFQKPSTYLTQPLVVGTTCCLILLHDVTNDNG